MIVEYIRYVLKNHTPEQLEAGYVTASEHLRAAPECLGYALTQCTEDTMSYILRIHWSSAEAHLQGFRGGPNFPPFLAAIKPFIPEIAEMRHYRDVGSFWR